MPGLAAIHYAQGSPAPEQYGRPNTVVVAQWHAARVFRAEVEALRAKGAEVLMYVLPPHSYPHVASGQPEQALWYNGGGTTMDHGKTPREWFWFPDQPDRLTVNEYGGRLMDLRPGSAWVAHTIECMATYLRELPIDGFFLDVVGSDYMGWVRKGTDDPTAQDLNQMRAASRAYVSTVRDALGPEAILVNNNAWSATYPAPAKSVNGVCAENHDPPDEWWKGQLARIDAPLGRRRNISLSRQASQARAWHATGLAYAAHSADYSQAPEALPFEPAAEWPADAGHIPGWKWQDTPAPEPEPDPTPEPEPDPEPANPHRISPELAAAIVDAVTHRMAQQAGRARTVLGPEYVGRLRDAGMAGLADAIEQNVATAIAANADTLVQDIAALIAGAEAA